MCVCVCEGTHGLFPVACSFLLVYNEQKYHFVWRGGPHTMDGIILRILRKGCAVDCGSNKRVYCAQHVALATHQL
jgi:hypothetical protein